MCYISITGVFGDILDFAVVKIGTGGSFGSKAVINGVAAPCDRLFMGNISKMLSRTSTGI